MIDRYRIAFDEVPGCTFPEYRITRFCDGEWNVFLEGGKVFGGSLRDCAAKVRSLLVAYHNDLIASSMMVIRDKDAVRELIFKETEIGESEGS